MTVLNGVNNATIATITVIADPFDVDVNPITNRAYITSRNPDEAWVVPDNY